SPAGRPARHGCAPASEATVGVVVLMIGLQADAANIQPPTVSGAQAGVAAPLAATSRHRSTSAGAGQMTSGIGASSSVRQDLVGKPQTTLSPAANRQPPEQPVEPATDRATVISYLGELINWYRHLEVEER